MPPRFSQKQLINPMEELVTFIQQEIANIAFKKVTPTESLIDSRLLDSISVVDLIVSIEERIGKQIPQHMITDENFETIESIIKTVNQL